MVSGDPQFVSFQVLRLACSKEMLENFNSIALESSVKSSSISVAKGVSCMLKALLAAKALKSLTTLRGGDEGVPEFEGVDPGLGGRDGKLLPCL